MSNKHSFKRVKFESYTGKIKVRIWEMWRYFKTCKKKKEKEIQTFIKLNKLIKQDS